MLSRSQFFLLTGVERGVKQSFYQSKPIPLPNLAGSIQVGRLDNFYGQLVDNSHYQLSEPFKTESKYVSRWNVHKPACHEWIRIQVFKLSRFQRLRPLETRTVGGGRGGGGRRVWLILILLLLFFFYFVSVSRLQQRESGSHHKFKRYGWYKHVTYEQIMKLTESRLLTSLITRWIFNN